MIDILTPIDQTCGTCGDSVSSRLESISSQLSALTRVVLGLGDTEAEQEEESYRAGSGHPEHIHHLTDFRAKSVMRELECVSESTEEDVEISVGEEGEEDEEGEEGSCSPARSE